MYKKRESNFLFDVLPPPPHFTVLRDKNDSSRLQMPKIAHEKISANEKKKHPLMAQWSLCDRRKDERKFFIPSSLFPPLFVFA